MHRDRVVYRFVRFLVSIKIFIQTIIALIINSDYYTIIKSIKNKKALISQSGIKRFCVPALNCYSCPMAVTSCPIGSLQFWFNDLAQKIKFKEIINLSGLYIIGILSLTGGLFGRLFCGWICPFGFIQDLISKITRKNINIPKILRSLRYVSLFVFVIILPLFIFDIRYMAPWFCKLLCPAGTLTAGVPLMVIDKSLRASISVITYIKITGLIIFLVSFFLSRRSFCKTLCPLGAFWGFFNKISLMKLYVDNNTCTNCKICEKVCPMNIKFLNNNNSTECIRCLECLKKCPTSSIKFGIYYNNKKG